MFKDIDTDEKLAIFILDAQGSPDLKRQILAAEQSVALKVFGVGIGSE
jgi:hypothetical protein